MNSSSFNPTDFIRPSIQDMEPYTPIIPFDILSEQLGLPEEQLIKLDANENPYGPSPLVRHALAEMPYIHSYPDPESRHLRRQLSRYTNLPAEYLMVGHGADELIDLVMRLFLEPGDQIINCPPTFGMYKFDAAINGAQVINIVRRADFSLDIAAIEEAARRDRTKLLFLTSPNNPDGSAIDGDTLRRFLNLPIVVILDEAYAEFNDANFLDWVPNWPNLIILRTFSKWAGLAGLRVGYGAIPLDIIAQLWKIKQPYNVNLAGQVAAQVSLEDAAYLLENVAKIIQTRTQLAAGLAQIDWLQPYPSRANFVLCRVIGKQAAQVKAALAQKGVLVRYYSSAGLEDHLRFSVGTPEQIERLLTILATL